MGKVLRMGGNKENMRQAMKELLGLVGFGPEEEGTPAEQPVAEQDTVRTVVTETTRVVEQPKVDPVPEPVAEKPVEEKPMAVISTEPEDTRKQAAAGAERGFFGFGRPKQPDVQPEPEPVFREVKAETVPETEPYFATAEEPEQKLPFIRPGATVIAAGATFFGDIRAEGDVEVLGKLKGNLEATGNIRIVGKVLGDVKGGEVVLEGCTVQGNITATSKVTLDESAMVVGDVLAADVQSAGKIKGNLQIGRAATFGATALLAGNVIAATIMMAQGARVQGAVRIAEDNETNSLFGELEI